MHWIDFVLGMTLGMALILLGERVRSYAMKKRVGLQKTIAQGLRRSLGIAYKALKFTGGYSVKGIYPRSVIGVWRGDQLLLSLAIDMRGGGSITLLTLSTGRKERFSLKNAQKGVEAAEARAKDLLADLTKF